MLVRVINPAGQMSLVGVGADGSVPVGQPVVAVINTQGISINAKDLDAAAKGRCNLCTSLTLGRPLQGIALTRTPSLQPRRVFDLDTHIRPALANWALLCCDLYLLHEQPTPLLRQAYHPLQQIT